MKIGIFSDAHGNLGGFLRALEIFGRVGVQELYYLGDMVGYVANLQVLEYLSAPDCPIQSILGNHDAMLLGDAIDATRDEVYQLNPFRENLGERERSFLKGLPVSRSWRANCGQILMVHGAPDDMTWGYVYPDTDLSPYASVPHDLIFMGNTHRPFIREAYGKRFVNVGSCGLPRDHGSLGSLCVLDTNTGDVEIFRFDLSDVHQQLQQDFPLHNDVRQLLGRRGDYFAGTFFEFDEGSKPSE